MKTIYLMRHAKSDWSNQLPDIERPLNPRGLRNAPDMAQRLLEREAAVQLIISSPAQRAQHTARLVAQVIGYTGELVLRDDLYFQGTEAALSVVHQLNDRVDEVLLVGHNPTWEELLQELVPRFRIAKFSTAGIAKIVFRTDTWANAKSQNADVEWFIFPKQFL